MQKSEAVKKSPDRSEVVPKRDWQGASVSKLGPKSGSVASYMTPNHDKPWCFCNAASRDLGIGAVGRGFFHSLSVGTVHLSPDKKIRPPVSFAGGLIPPVYSPGYFMVLYRKNGISESCPAKQGSRGCIPKI